ncbi:snare-like protein [Neocallimastix californiae]|uniref:Synaptobrevin homolog YKT6 n=1 Tax=Neocallimastix californiae TaxID=1754190 RepID=A0A1Y2BCY2_9FUNG|nr:snare-like protein [Neocallimastix californiae]|eukprot:ORY32673.1 snare-like protein [Neocallimastix californiae]
MKVFNISVLTNSAPAKLICAEQDLSSFGFFQRGSVQEFINFFSTTAAERTQVGERSKIEQQSYVGYVYSSTNGLAGVVVTDAEYPSRVAFSIINKVLDDFTLKYKKSDWENLDPKSRLEFPELKTYLTDFQDPHKADPFMKVQQELDETKVILHKTMDSLLQRGEKLDDLVTKSDQLSSQSKMFYKTSKKTNSCCYLMVI